MHRNSGNASIMGTLLFDYIKNLAVCTKHIIFLLFKMFTKFHSSWISPSIWEASSAAAFR